MALDRFRASPLPAPPAQYDPQYVRQLIRVIEVYFSQLDSRTPNNAEQYSADRFVGGSFSGTSITADDISTTTLDAVDASIGSLNANVVTSVYTDTDSLHAHSAEITTLMSVASMAMGGTLIRHITSSGTMRTRRRLTHTQPMASS